MKPNEKNESQENMIKRLKALEKQRNEDMFMLGQQIGYLTQRILKLEQLVDGQTATAETTDEQTEERKSERKEI